MPVAMRHKMEKLIRISIIQLSFWRIVVLICYLKSLLIRYGMRRINDAMAAPMKTSIV